MGKITINFMPGAKVDASSSAVDDMVGGDVATGEMEGKSSDSARSFAGTIVGAVIVTPTPKGESEATRRRLGDGVGESVEFTSGTLFPTTGAVPILGSSEEVQPDMPQTPPMTPPRTIKVFTIIAITTTLIQYRFSAFDNVGDIRSKLSRFKDINCGTGACSGE